MRKWLYAATLLVAMSVCNGCGSDAVVPGPSSSDAGPSAAADVTKVGASCKNNNECNAGPCMSTAVCIENVCQAHLKQIYEGRICDDGSLCTNDDKCDAAGSCAGVGLDCNDKNPCTSDSCEKVKGCKNDPIAVACDDGSVCTTGDKCDDGKCVATGNKSCDDTNACTSDSCDPLKGCINANNANSCDDGNVCTDGDACKDGACASGSAKVCNDNNVCTDDLCDPKLGCKFVAKADKPAVTCSDKDPSTADDVCVGGTCTGKPFYQCETDAGCALTIQTPCGKPMCVPVDATKPNAEKTCKVFFTLNVDDGNTCTTDSCDYIKGPLHEAIIGGTCDDSNVCTILDACAADKSCKGSAKSCDDSDACTTDFCDKNTGACVHTQMTCEDGDLFTENFCSAGTCKSIAYVIMAKAQLAETFTAKEVADNKLSTKLNSWVEDVVGELSMSQPIKASLTLDAKSTCNALYVVGSKLCFNSWMLIGVTKEEVNIGGEAVQVSDSITTKTGGVIKPKVVSASFYEQPDACLGWEEIPVCVAGKGK